jgi:hypothetical protein
LNRPLASVLLAPWIVQKFGRFGAINRSAAAPPTNRSISVQPPICGAALVSMLNSVGTVYCA